MEALPISRAVMLTLGLRKVKPWYFGTLCQTTDLDESTYHEGLAPKNGKEKWICYKVDPRSNVLLG